MTTEFEKKLARKNLVTWILSGLAALAFLGAGATKLGNNPQMVANFQAWGFSDSFRLFVGASELAGAIGLLIPIFATLAASGLAVIMTGAVLTHLSHEQVPQSLAPLVLLVLVLYIAFARRDAIGALLNRRQGTAAAH